jgi:RimJ/RimL family protein N-acetyltransferase
MVTCTGNGTAAGLDGASEFADRVGSSGTTFGEASLMRIRTVTEDDALALCFYAEALFAEHLPGIYDREAPTLEQELAFIRSHTEPENSTMFVAEEDRRVLGNIGFIGRTLAEERHAGEFGLSVAKEYRGRGIGTALIEALLAWAPAHGIWRVEVKSWSNNPGSKRLYERMGFAEEGLARAAIIRDGEMIDVIMMARLLP